MTRNEFIEKIENGRDILFEVGGKKYAVFTWLEDGIGIGERERPGAEIRCFQSAQMLIDRFQVNGVPLSHLLSRLRITEYN